ncbi:hypothetical protein ACBR40_04820 [Nonomuraea sp. AD125B]|uniref:hypothetical protein n=1 Tax=Nonomuraea sp. AD125B TaxID=3242897 RepID=UPI003529938D
MVSASAKNTFNWLIGQLTDTARGMLTHDRLKETIVEQGRELQRQLLQAPLICGRYASVSRRTTPAKPASTQWAPEVPGSDAAAAAGDGPSPPAGHPRRDVDCHPVRLAPSCVRNVYPADTALSLPGARHSAGLAKLAVIETVRGSFDAAHAALVARCGNAIGERQIEQASVAATVDGDAVYAERTVLPCTACTVLAISVDGKGIAMRPRALRPPPPRPSPAPGSPFEPGRRRERNRSANGWPPCGLRRRARPPPPAPRCDRRPRRRRAGQRLPRPSHARCASDCAARSSPVPPK